MYGLGDYTHYGLTSIHVYILYKNTVYTTCRIYMDSDGA